MSRRNIKAFSINPIFKFEDGTEFTVHQILLSKGKYTKLYWRCLCGHTWKGHKRLRWLGRKPSRCPKCGTWDPYGKRIRSIKK